MSKLRLSSLNSLIGGFSQGYRAVDSIRQDEEDRKWVSMQRVRQQKQWDDADKLKTDLANDAAPAEVQPTMVKDDTQDNRDVGQPGEAAPVQRGFNVKGQQFASMTDATKAASDHNAPSAVTARMSSTLMRAGKPVEAQQLRAGARQERVADMQLSDMERQHVDRLYDRQMDVVRSFDALGEFISNSKGDGRGGELKVKAVVSPDGKTVTVHQVNADGSTTATPYSFSNDARGLTQAKLMLAKSATTADKLAHLHQQAMESIARQNADTQAGYRSDQAENMREQRRLEERKLGILEGKNAPAAPSLEPFDAKLARETAHDAVKAENKRRADAGQPLLTGQEAAALTDSYVGAQRAQHNNNLVIAAALNDLSGLDPTSPEYAQAYNRALSFGDPKQIGAQLQARGAPPPRGPVTKAELISREVAKNGDKDYIVDINGSRRTYGNAKMTDAAGKQAASPAAQPVAGMASVAADGPQGAALDQARAARVQAQQVLAKFGLQQRAADPQGFAAAQAALAAAKQAEADAERAWQATVGQADRAFPRMSQAVAR